MATDQIFGDVNERIGVFERVFEASGDGIWEWNLVDDSRARYSDFWFSMLGFDVDDLAHDANTFFSLVHPEDEEFVQASLESHLASRGQVPYHVQIRMRCKSGDYTLILSRGMATFDESGRPVSMAGTHTDISRFTNAHNTLKASLERALLSAQRKAQIVSMASHEFRTPLSVLGSSLALMQLVSERMDCPQQRDQLLKPIERANHAIGDLTRIVEDILSLARYTSGHYQPQYTLCSIQTLLLEVLNDVTSAQTSASRRVKLKYPRKLVLQRIDPFVFKIICSNLIANALKYSKGQVEVEVLVNKAQGLLVSVTDFGIGIPEEDIEHIFKPSFRASNAKVFSGNGLGLSLCHHLATACEGHLLIDSVEHVKTRFTLILPLEQPDAGCEP